MELQFILHFQLTRILQKLLPDNIFTKYKDDLLSQSCLVARRGICSNRFLTELYQNADIQEKRLIISSMFPENLTFDEVQHRTTRLNEAIRVFNALKADFGSKNKGKLVFKTDLPSKVA
jgi:hypothetical protein